MDLKTKMMNDECTFSFVGLLSIMKNSRSAEIHLAVQECMATSAVEYLASLKNRIKMKGYQTRDADIVTTRINIEKKIQAHSLAILKAWAELPALNTELQSLKEVLESKEATRNKKQALQDERVQNLYEADQKKRNLALRRAQLWAEQVVELGRDAEDLKDQEEDNAIAEEEKKEQLRKTIAGSCPPAIATKLIKLLQKQSAADVTDMLILLQNKEAMKLASNPPSAQPPKTLSVNKKNPHKEKLQKEIPTWTLQEYESNMHPVGMNPIDTTIAQHHVTDALLSLPKAIVNELAEKWQAERDAKKVVEKDYLQRQQDELNFFAAEKKQAVAVKQPPPPPPLPQTVAEGRQQDAYEAYAAKKVEEKRFFCRFRQR